MRIFFIIVIVFFAGFQSVIANAQTYVLKGERIISNSAQVAPGSDVVVIVDGIVEQIGKSPEGATASIPGDNLWITPGIFAPYSTLGLVEVSGESATNNIRSANKQATVSIRAADSFNPKSTIIAVSRLGGVTHAAVVPGAGSDLFGGLGMIVSTSGEFNSAVDEAAFIYLNYYGSSDKTGSTKGAAMAFLRAALSDASSYSSRFEQTNDGDALRRADANALRPVIRGDIPMLVGADQAIDILNIIKLKSDYPRLDVIIVGAAEAWMVADQLASSNVAVIVDPLENLPSSFDQIATRLDNVKRLMDAGVTTAIMSQTATGGTAHNLRLITQHAGNAVAAGLTWEQAFKAITLTPASMFGQPELGQIRIGQKANLVVWDGDPLEATSAPVAVFIDGKLQSMQSRQTKLRDRYNPANTDKPGSNGKYGYQP